MRLPGRLVIAFCLVAAAPATAQPPEQDGAWAQALLVRVDEVAKDVAKARGLAVKQPIVRDVVSVAELRRRLVERASTEKSAAEIAGEELAAKRWGMLPPDASLGAMMIDVLTEQIAGYYDPETKRLYIAAREGGLDQWGQMLLAHEIDHALQDQHFDLEKWMDLPPGEGDQLAARQAVVEGDGVALMIELLLSQNGGGAPWGNPAVMSSMSSSMDAVGGSDALGKAPLVVRESLLFPYRAGLGFVAGLRATQPWSAIDKVFRQPPRSTEQILHLAAYLAGEEPIAVPARKPAALAGWDLAHDTVWGEQGVSVFLREHGVSTERATTAAAGWGGDRALILRRPGTSWRRAAGIVCLVWDSEADAVEATEALGDAVAQLAIGPAIERGPERMRWLDIDGRLALVERRGDRTLVAIGVPPGAAAAVVDELLTTQPASPAPPAKRPAGKRPGSGPAR